MSPEDDWIRVGRVAGAFGVRGEMKVESFTDFPQRFATLKTIYIGSERTPLTVLSGRANKHILLKLEGVDSPEHVARLRGQDLWLPRSEAVPLGKDEFYADDIIGLRVETDSGEVLGDITDILRTGANDVYIVKGARGELLIPAIHDVVREIDIVNRRIVITVVKGMLG